MRPSRFLSIVIPTYNRADFLDKNLEKHVPLASMFNIEICISDNASTDDTAIVVSKWMQLYPFIKFHKNENNFGPDENIFCALRMATANYIWLLGDTYQFGEDVLRRVYEIASSENVIADMIVLNAADRVKKIHAKLYSDPNSILIDIGWHMTCLSCLVYSKDIIAGAECISYKGTNFLQTGLALDYIARNPKSIVAWEAGYNVHPLLILGLKKRGWQPRTFSIWTEDWPNFVLSLSSIFQTDAKLKCIKDHGVKSGLFSIASLFNLRSDGFFSLKIYWRYRKNIPFVISLSKFSLVSIALCPRWPLQFVKKRLYVLHCLNRRVKKYLFLLKSKDIFD